MSPALEGPGPYQTEKMSNGSCPSGKMSPVPLLGFQETQGKQNGATHVTIPPSGEKSREAGPEGLLSWLKAGAHRWAVPSVVLNLTLIPLLLIIILIALSAKQREPCPATPAYLVAACPDGWVGYLGNCYYFSEAEANWTSSQSNCSALGASLAGIDTQQEMDFMMRYKGPSDYWIGLQREPGQPWKWTNGTEFNNWFKILGGEQCAFMNEGDIASSRCSREAPWICSKRVEKTEGKAK